MYYKLKVFCDVCGAFHTEEASGHAIGTIYTPYNWNTSPDFTLCPTCIEKLKTGHAAQLLTEDGIITYSSDLYTFISHEDYERRQDNSDVHENGTRP